MSEQKITLQYIISDSEPEIGDTVFDVVQKKLGKCVAVNTVQYFELLTNVKEYVKKGQYVLMGIRNGRMTNSGDLKKVYFVQTEDEELFQLLKAKYQTQTYE